MHNGHRNQQRSDSAPIDVWHKILFTSVGTVFLKIYSFIPNVAMDLPTTCVWWSKGSMETLKNMTGKKFVLLAGLQKKTEINAEVNLRDINKNMSPYQPCNGWDHTLTVTGRVVDWPSSNIRWKKERGDCLGEEQRKQNFYVGVFVGVFLWFYFVRV